MTALQGALGKQYTPSVDELERTPDPKWGDIAFPCFGLAKGMAKPPAEIAAELAPKIEPKGLISKVEARGPYINFFVDADAVGQETLEEILKLKSGYGAWTTGKGKKVMVEYAQPNTHKAVHVGHVRNFLVGKSTVALLRAIGYQVVTASYHGDVGTHVATTLWGLLKFHKDEEPSKTGRGEWLGKIYTEATSYIEKHPKAKTEVQELNQKLMAGDPKLQKLWQKTRKWSIEEFKNIFRELGMKFDKMYYEGDMDAPGKKIVAELLTKGIARESQGAIVVPLEEYGLETFLILKSDGTTLYSTRDLTLAALKLKEWKIDRSLLVVDVRQSLHFKQLAKTLELMGFKKPLIHIPYEFVTLPGGTISSRKGELVTYEEFLETIETTSYNETKKRHKDWSEKKLLETAHRIAFAGMHFGMLAQDLDRPITFDIKKAISFDGFTGPYIQYTGARIAGILRKAPRSSGKDKTKFSASEPSEQKLVLLLAGFPNIVLRAANDLRPAPLATYLFDLAKAFSEFYETVPVLKAPKEKQKPRLDLIQAVRIVLENGAGLLGFEIPEEM